MELFKEMKKERSQRYQKDTTVIQIKAYQIHEDPRQCKIIGVDLLNNDANGVPKQVEISFNDPSGKSMGIQEFADPSAWMHTEVGGTVRVDKFIERGTTTNKDGQAVAQYVTGHMQRVQKNEQNRKDKKQNEYSTGVMKGWVKVIPQRDQSGEIAENVLSSGMVVSRGKALVIPDDAKPATITFGSPDFREQLSAMVEKAVDMAPQRSKPIILLRAEGPENQAEAILQTVKKNPDNSYSPMVKEEILEAARTNTELGMWLSKNDEAVQAGVEVPAELLPGMQLDLVGMVNDPRSGNRQEKPKVQSMVRDTTRWFPIPKESEAEEQRFEAAKKAEYKLSVISYEINLTDESRQASLQTLGVVPGVVASPDAGLSRTPNPYWPETAAPSAPTSAPSSTSAQPAPEAKKQTPEASKPAAQQVEETEPQPGETQDELAMLEMDEEPIPDFDFEDINSQLQSQGY